MSDRINARHQTKCQMHKRNFAFKKATRTDLEDYLEDDKWRDVFRFDEFKQQIYRFQGTEQRELRDLDFKEVGLAAEKDWGLMSTNSEISDAIMWHADKYRYNSARDYFEYCFRSATKRMAWDTLHQYLGVEAEYLEYAKEVLRKWLLAATLRVLHPGYKHDWALVLVGPQGCGKSSLLRILAGDDRFTDQMPKDLSNKDASQYLVGCLIVELAEFQQRLGDQNAIKDFLSRQTDRYRSPYEKLVCSHPRTCVFGITTNDDEFLRDSTGARRFVTLPVRDISLEWFRENVEELWGNAYGKAKELDEDDLRDGKATRLNLTAQEIANDLASNAQETNLYLEKVREAVSKCDGSFKQFVTTEDVLERIGVATYQIKKPKKQVEEALRLLGYHKERRQFDGKRQRGWAIPSINGQGGH